MFGITLPKSIQPQHTPVRSQKPILPLYDIHLFFDLLSATVTATVTYILAKGVLASNLHRIESIGLPYYFGLALGAIWGAFTFGTLNLWISGTDGIGRSILGALIGAIIMVELAKLFTGAKTSTGALFVPAFTLSTVIGRWGCFFSGLDDHTHGIRTQLPIGVDFGDGPRHPVQLYESAAMGVSLIILAILIIRAPDVFRKYGFYLMCIFYGSQRFLWEFLKPYTAVLGPLNLFHIGCIFLIGYGLWMIKNARQQA